MLKICVECEYNISLFNNNNLYYPNDTILCINNCSLINDDYKYYN